jgi:trans-aconitate 2-methyltransferase
LRRYIVELNSENNNWDAENYHRVSTVQESWATELLEKRKIGEYEVVMDAGCGTGRVTGTIANAVKKGRVYAVDIDVNMITKAKENLKDFSNITFIKSDISEVRLPEKIDLIFSNAAIHWILDHKKLFSNFWELLKPNGELLIQCGGKGNLELVHTILEKLRKGNTFKHYFADWKSPWNFASPADVKKTLSDIGFNDTQAQLKKKTAKFENHEEFVLFMKTVVMKPYLAYLPADNNNETRNSFMGEFINELTKNQKTNKADVDLKLEYVRLDITGRK